MSEEEIRKLTGLIIREMNKVVKEIKERLAVTTSDIERITAQLAALK